MLGGMITQALMMRTGCGMLVAAIVAAEEIEPTDEEVLEVLQPTAEREGVLEVTCEAAVWAQELDLMAVELIPRLNDALGEQAISRLRCRTG